MNTVKTNTLAYFIQSDAEKKFHDVDAEWRQRRESEQDLVGGSGRVRTGGQDGSRGRAIQRRKQYKQVSFIDEKKVLAFYKTV